MDIMAIALTVCLKASVLDCDAIDVEIKKIQDGVAGQALLYTSGRMKIEVSRGYASDSTPRKIRELLVHEYSHLVTYVQGEVKVHHGKVFRKNCMELAEKLEVRKSTCTTHANH